MALAKWISDPVHSEVTFKIRHLMISNLTGVLGKFTVEAETIGMDFHTAKVSFTGEASTITTYNAYRDKHLQGKEFFDAEKFPQIRFNSTRSENAAGEGYKMYGDLTIGEITQSIKLDVEFGGTVKDPEGNTKAGFSVQTVISRNDFDLNWNMPLESGGVLIGDEVKIFAEIQMVKQVEEIL